MNLSAFSSYNFDPKKWINSAFQGPEAQDNKEAYASQVAFKLQLFIQEMNSALEETAQQVQQNLPNVLRDVANMQQEAAFLRQQMVVVQKDIEKVEHDSFRSMKTLLEIDKIKLRMLQANEALREADNWTTLSSDVDQIFQTGNVQNITELLVGMQSSLEVLADVADYQVRSQLLETLKNRLEAMLGPYLVQAFSSQSVDGAKTCVRIFTDIHRLPQLLKYYHTCQKSKLLESWQKIVESQDSFLPWLNNFYDLMLSTWHEQTRWCAQVFPEPPSVFVMADIIVDVVSSLDPSLSFCLDAAIRQQDIPSAYLLNAMQATRRFCKSVQVSISGIQPAYVNNPHVVTLVKTLYAFCRPHIENYGALEEKHLLSQLSALNMSSDSIVDSVNLMSDSVGKIFLLAKESEARCTAVSCGCSYPQLVAVLDSFFCAYYERCSLILGQLKSISKCESWTLFQHSLKCMQSCGEMVLQLGTFESTLTCNIKSVLKQLEEGVENYLLTPQLQKELGNFAMQLHLKDFVLLAQSNARVRQLCVDFSQFAFDTVFAEIRSHLAQVPNMMVWTEDLPQFSLSPLEYITQIGQYLLTIPQHIEPFIVEENEALKIALGHSKLEKPTEGVDHIADYLLGCVARDTMRTYIDVIIQIERLTSQASSQLATDIGYLCNVLDDLGLTPLDSLQHLMALLKCPPQELAMQDGQLAQMVKTMRASH
ncbi:conserved oligomeric Golgi complex subunit 7-like [Ornithodoros turicata]|uniref:Conserved oligomeric Golgi complex subunit 7 n=1 Tax=Ornithodoros turicata TaxID=34597 RepID=A0A2R5LNB6_9ACAR